MESETKPELTKRGRLFLICTYGLFILVSTAFGGFLSTEAQPGGITFGTAVLAVLIGPWSAILPPNAHAIRAWNVEHALFAICLTALLGFAVVGSWFAEPRWLRYLSIVLSLVALAGWILAGLFKVVLEMS